MHNKSQALDWILKIKTNENEALKEIYRLCREECIQWLQKDFGLPVEDALDVFQISVVILYDNVMTGKLLELTSGIQTYLKGIARNKALELIRSRKNYVNDDITSLMSQYICNEDEEYKEKEVLINTATLALDELGNPCRTLLQEYYYFDRSMDDITAKMGYKNTDTAKNQKYKCLKRLQKIYFSHINKNEKS